MGVSQTVNTNYVLIDYENIQPKNLHLLSDKYFQIYLFLGAQQDRLKLELIQAMHELGPNRSKYIRATQTRPNALDFYITYYLGELTAQNPYAYFHIISKDKGFDPLIEHLKAQNVQAYRRESISDIPLLHIGKTAPIDQKLQAIVKNLKGRGSSKPRTEKTLKNTIQNTFAQTLSSTEVELIYEKLISANYASLKGGKISYTLANSE